MNTAVSVNQIEKILDDKVRPELSYHGGDIRIESLEGDLLKVRLTGNCSGCPSANTTMESIVKEEILKAFPEIKDVVLVTGVSDEMINEARRILGLRHGKG